MASKRAYNYSRDNDSARQFYVIGMTVEAPTKGSLLLSRRELHFSCIETIDTVIPYYICIFQ